mmetsp:Transcript_82/g.259  ORF Transcript_82/g.259 Transcript_82/m.259 type:complete len:197 (+) Transcript_82:74-664(+)
MTVDSDMIVVKGIGRGNCQKSPRVTKLAMQFIVCPPVASAACGADDAAQRAQKDAGSLGTQCGGMYHKISDALEASEDGDTIRIYPGEYNERIFITKAVTLHAVDAATGGDADGGGAASSCTVTVTHDGHSTVASTAIGARLEGIRFVHTGGDTTGRGRDGPRCLEAYDGELTVTQCIFTSSTGSAVMSVGGGPWC